MSYQRVLPRDLFNEAKLLKCLGQLALTIHEGKGIRWPLRLEHDTTGTWDSEEGVFLDDHKGFVIDQRSSDGGMYCDNLELWCYSTRIHLYTAMNSREPYPLIFWRGSQIDTEDAVFNDDGGLSQEFSDFLDTLQEEENAAAEKRGQRNRRV